MGAIVDFAARVERAEAKLEKCSITERNKELILSFCEAKTAQKVKLPRIAKYLSTLRCTGMHLKTCRVFMCWVWICEWV